MATAKKKSVKKAPVKKTVKKSPVKSASRPATVSHQTFKRSANSTQFMQARFTEQTVYWLIIGAAVIGLAVWVLSIQVRLDDMYDSIDASVNQTIVPSKKSSF
ncbi:hypothetical protein KA093_02730 [Candidatus Saccharibacteria bacterium]|nr:hypothetical protein [Candidatus Saccharibacteria bacterium]